MAKTTFMERYEKAVKFYDHNYHMHKATFKGLASFYKNYSSAEKAYADAIINLTKSVWEDIPELRTQHTTLLSAVKEIVNSLQTTSQLHFNYGDRLLEVSNFYQGEYLTSKRKKENHMKIIKDRTSSEYEAFREKNRSREALNDKQKEICKVLYQNFEKLAEEENDRIQKIKEQTIIYFSLYKKICEKQLQRANDYNLKLVKQEFQVKHPEIQEMAEQVRIQHNEYGGEQIQRRSYDVNQSMVFNRESLRNSLIIKQRQSKVSDFQSQLKNTVDRFENGPSQLEVVIEPNSSYGLLDCVYFSKASRVKLSREYSSIVIRTIVYDMLDGYTNTVAKDTDTLLLLQLIKGNLKINSPNKAIKNFQSISEFWQVNKSHPDKNYAWHLIFIQKLCKIYSLDPSSIDMEPLYEHILAKKKPDAVHDPEILETIPIQISACLMDVLIDAICVSRENEQVLVDGYIDFLVLFARFGEAILGLQRNFTVLIMLRKVERLIINKPTNQELQQILGERFFTEIATSKKKQINEKREDFKENWIYELVNNCSKQILFFYDRKPSLLNYVKILLIIEKLGLIFRQRFNATERVYMGIKYAGFNFIKTSQTNLKILSPDGWSGEERLQNIVEVTEDLDYEGVLNNIINPAATQLGRLLGVGENKVQNKMFDEFTEAFYKIMEANLEIISEQEGTDKDGYALRLGIILARLDLLNPLPLNEYDPFFKVLKAYLESTEKQYDQLLEHSRQTQLWIMEENSLATPNCIDFCSLLYKPFEFLLTSLKKLEEAHQTDYTKKYSEFIKLKLNTDLRDQIIKYVNFLYQSLTLYESSPPELSLKPRRLEKMHKITKEETEKDRYNFKQLTRRLFNLLFLKDQLEEMIEDFLDPQLYNKLNKSIFNLDKLKKYSSQSVQYREILKNIQDIVSVVLSNQDRIVKKVANITVFHFFRKLFDNLYFQDEKNAIEEFFRNDSDYKLSPYTFVRFQDQLEEWFAVIAKNIPDDFIDEFSAEFSRAFYQAIRFQALNSTKFKIPLSASKIVPFLDSDITFMTTLMKQKFFDENVIETQIQKPFQKVLEDIRSQTGKLAGIFESATLKNDKQRCKYVLVILNLRPKDEKAVEFIKKYKTIVK